jgi:hypothetical protein
MHAADISGNIVDLKGLEYFRKEKCIDSSEFHTMFMKYFYTKFNDYKDINSIVPIMHLVKYCEDYCDYISQFVQFYNKIPGFDFHNEVVVPSCNFMEKSGVHVYEDKFIEVYGERFRNNVNNSLVYTEYNPYTTTGRVTSRFGGINFSAIEKSSDSRDAYTSRFGKFGSMVLIDFESFHLRLIANMMNISLPNEPVHEYLAKQYYGTKTISPEEYSEGKKITFKYLYSETEEGSEYPFFNAVYEFKKKFWETSNVNGFFISSTKRRIYLNNIESVSPAKLFNYYLQLEEMETVFKSIHILKDIFKKYKSKVTLYTYDSILIDFAHEDGKDLLINTCKILESDGKFPVRLYAGNTYKSVQDKTFLIK